MGKELNMYPKDSSSYNKKKKQIQFLTNQINHLKLKIDSLDEEQSNISMFSETETEMDSIDTRLKKRNLDKAVKLKPKKIDPSSSSKHLKKPFSRKLRGDDSNDSITLNESQDSSFVDHKNRDILAKGELETKMVLRLV